MSDEIMVGERLVQAGEDGRPERVVEVTGVMHRDGGVEYEVRPLGSKRARMVPASELGRIVAVKP